MSDMIPVYKVGGVILRQLERIPEVLLVRPHPKHEGDITSWVLPKGSRMYRDARGKWHDARDKETAIAHEEQFEHLHHTLHREMYEEAGIPHGVMRKDIPLYEMGERLFASRSKEPYGIYWFILMPDEPAQERFATVPQDAQEVRWASLKDIAALMEADDFSPGYLPVIEEAIALMKAGSLPEVKLRAARG
jgi:8-oxo-dGTP pyrophosphatase MutT (NUDIX family)